MADSSGSDFGWRLFSGLAGAGAAFGARKALTLAWTQLVGHSPPDEPAHPRVQLGRAIAWAAASGLVVGVARMLAQRRAAGAWERATGALPGPLLERGD